MAKQEQQQQFPPQRQAQQPGLPAEMQPKPESIGADYRGANQLAGKVALLTGGDSSIGRAVALHYAREGADVAIVYKHELLDTAASGDF